MIVLAWCLFVIVSFLVASNQAFLNAPIPAHSVSSYSIGAERRMESNKATQGANDNRQSVDSKSNDNDDDVDGGGTVYVIAFEGKEESAEKERDTEESGPHFVVVNGSDLQNPLDPWSIVWYIGSFGGLVAFFLIVSCSEWCCRRGSRPMTVPYAQRADAINTTGITETPPPPYHLFAPPSYDSVNYGEIVDKTSGEKLDIYVISVPIHRPQVVQAPA
ncbi:uncharacterized protein LOC112456678 isoform X1 [Temnothorax curvispinosus]|uniref:Uncharacterized protein LOC112456587 isoform X1 n=1 Tax=Temnothorax curvispinosus TaxID=300111 RepID=A0A6J1Q2D7_9HYME|nr:uncharacterized protein LOC112456587 isoform X1 [Temnothorax curvispinosus]XP_024875135.1 uncharacterized protein LOC112456678 isoform X1 [Temnothorax curvispinosus]